MGKGCEQTTWMEVCLESVRFHAYYGLLPQEKQVGNEFELNIQVRYQLKDAEYEADDLSQSLCYAELYKMAQVHLKKRADTLEYACSAIGTDIYNHWPWVNSVEVSITKLSPPIPGFHGRAKVIWRSNRVICSEN